MLFLDLLSLSESLVHFLFPTADDEDQSVLLCGLEQNRTQGFCSVGGVGGAELGVLGLCSQDKCSGREGRACQGGTCCCGVCSGNLVWDLRTMKIWQELNQWCVNKLKVIPFICFVIEMALWAAAATLWVVSAGDCNHHRHDYGCDWSILWCWVWTLLQVSEGNWQFLSPVLFREWKRSPLLMVHMGSSERIEKTQTSGSGVSPVPWAAHSLHHGKIRKYLKSSKMSTWKWCLFGN